MARLTEAECASLGGTFVVYDAARPETAIERWLPFAEGGDADAQYRLGLLYEGVMDAEPDYEKAAYWYERAAQNDHRESMYALSVLYEKGLGVEQDIVKALNLYRSGAGLSADSLMLSSEALQQIEEVRSALGGEISKLARQRDALESQVATLKEEAAYGPGGEGGQLQMLMSLLAELNGDLVQKEQQLAALPSYRRIDPSGGRRQPTRFDFPPLPAQKMRSREVGKYYALIVGNRNYDLLEPLQTPHNDARRIAEILSGRYGFTVQLLFDADEEQLKRAIHAVTSGAGPGDNVLIYFAGHGHLRRPTQHARLAGYWLPTNADRDQDVNWVDNWWITSHLDAADARRVFVIADSCYGGVFSTDLPIGPVAELPELSNDDLDKKLQRRSRFVLASGGDAPVIDATGPEAEHSVFAGALIGVLEANDGAMSVVELYGRVFDEMYASLTAQGLEQEPELRVIRAAGHESEGDFFFVAN